MPRTGQTKKIIALFTIIVTRSALYTHSTPSRRSSYHPNIMESKIPESSLKPINRESSHIGCHILTRLDTLAPPRKQKKKDTPEKKCSGTAVLPMAAAVLVAFCLEGPVMFVAGLMGYTTGKIIQERRSVECCNNNTSHFLLGRRNQ